MPNKAGLPTEQDFVPPAVRRASAAADAIHQQTYQTPEPPKAPAASDGQAENFPVVDPPTSPEAPKTTPAASAGEPEPPKPAPNGQDYTDPATNSDIQTDPWAGRYNSMRGRWAQAQTTIGTMQEQMSELGDELLRTQQALQLARQARSQPEPEPQRRQSARQSVTDDDVKQYGTDLIDFVQRAARDAIAPDLSQVSTEIRQTNQRVARTATQTLYADLDRDVPTWRQVNVDPEFKAWCHLRDVYSGVVRGAMLKDAFTRGDAARVAQFFKGYLAERQATGHDDPVVPQPQASTAPRQPAVQLETLTAPGRAKPAGGEGAAFAAEKPVFTRAQIKSFYDNVRRGGYAGREAEKTTMERAIFAAQSDGRVR